MGLQAWIVADTNSMGSPLGELFLVCLGQVQQQQFSFPMSMSSLVKFDSNVLKGPKLEIFDSGVFTQIRPVWVGDLGTRPKTFKSVWFGLENRRFVFLSAVAGSA